MAKISINLKEGTIADKDRIIGIDLGTTHSLVAYMKDGKPLTIKDEDGKNALVPSIIHFEEDGSVLVGNEAKEQLVIAPERTIFSVKRLMGKSYPDIASFKSFFSYKIIDDDTESLVKIRVGDAFYNPIELSSQILRALKKRVETALGETVSKAVITVPAYFNDAQRQATRDAGKLAGLDVLRIVNEPTAASLAYGINAPDEPQNVAVFDLGGGTFDISILHIEDGIFEVLSTNGDTFLGGDDFDQVIQSHWQAQLNISDETLTAQPDLRQILRLEAEKAKKTLSSQESFEGQIEDHIVYLYRSTFEELIEPLLERMNSKCQNAIKDAGINKADIDHVLLVGGSTRVPAVKNAVGAFFEKTPNDSLNPDEVVAMGAAIQADILAGNQNDMLLLDITPLSLGIETVGGLMDVILPRNSKVPARVARNYTTSIDGQKNLKIAVFQGERDLVENNRKLGEFILRDIPPMPAGIPKIEIAFIIDADGILKVRAKELRSDTMQEIEIRSAYGISEEEMGKMLLESIENAQSDIAEKAIREAINEANHIIKSTERFIEQNEDFFEKETLDQLSSLKVNLEQKIASRDKNIIEAAMADLNDFATPLAHEAMDKNIGAAIKGTKID